jgi:dienelactone hydrolase
MFISSEGVFVQKNLIGAYGAWAKAIVGDEPGALSLRSGRFRNVETWRRQARSRLWEVLQAPELPTPRPTVLACGWHDGLQWEKLSWQLPWGPRTDAVFLKPETAKPGQKLKAILALHDHGGKKYFGWRKIASIERKLHPLLKAHRDSDYGGLAWANEAARRGYAVLVHDTFLFGSRRVKLQDVLPAIANGVSDVGPDENPKDIEAYNRWAGGHEHIMAKSLFSAGTTWPGVFLREDQAALSILCARPDVDPKRVACGGLSGGGLRTVFLAGMDDRIRTCFCAGFFTTWRDLVLNKSFTHTWMTYVPLLPRELDFCEILALRAPKPTLVLNCDKDPLYTLKEVRRAARMIEDVYRRAGAPKAFRFSLHPGGHQLHGRMQQEAFEWLDRELEK